MELAEFIQQYTEDVYGKRDPEAATRYIADPCLRHEHGQLVTMPLADNIARIRGFLDQAAELTFDTPILLSDGEYLASCYNATIGSGESARTVSAVEVFRVVDGKITETWNTPPQPGAWG